MNLFDKKSLIDGNSTHIATVRPDGSPNLAVVADIKVLGEDRLLVSHNEMANTVNNIKHNPRVVLTSFDKNWGGAKIIRFC
ncbi:pyridoxamine 5'-phosphate oxidase family protein [Candidatus Saccharibacteria bacterium]|nr:pyridoxamine 5'-phosphate oxidase family protein [Candidatus Saccharibacteria bacterium]